MGKIQLGIDRLIHEPGLQKELKGKRVALLGHPASVTSDLEHSLDALSRLKGFKISSAFGPQHGMRGEQQYNMMETEDGIDPVHKIPVFSLYGKVRRPTAEMIDSFDVILIDLQDVGCRIYTFVTTLLYVLEACQGKNKSVWVLDRPNPAGRPIEGSLLKPGQESFVGAASIIMRHGMTLGEMAHWFVGELKLDVDLKVIEMKQYDPEAEPGCGWPLLDLSWVNPSPNLTTPFSARCYPGTVMVEGTTLSEGRGTTRPLELLGAPDLEMDEILDWMRKEAPNWMEGCRVRPCYFKPTFYKHESKLCRGFQIHVDGSFYDPETFRPYRLISLFFKALKQVHPHYGLWRDFKYEYVEDRLAIDVINGGDNLRKWVDDPKARVQDWDQFLKADEAQWKKSRQKYLIY